MPERTGYSVPLQGVPVEQEVEVGQQSVSDGERLPGNAGQRLPEVSRVLICRPESVVIPTKGVEGPQLVPSDAELLCGVANEATDVGPDHRYSELIELEHPDHGVLQIRPVGEVVAKPEKSKFNIRKYLPSLLFINFLRQCLLLA